MGKVWRKQHGNLFRRAVAKAGLPKTFVFHGLRHTYASDLVRSGVLLDVVARQLGHANTRTVSDTYGHLSAHYREEQVRMKFSTLSSEFAAVADKRQPQLTAMREQFRQGNWREYGVVRHSSSHPLQAFGSGDLAVQDLFQLAERSDS